MKSGGVQMFRSTAIVAAAILVAFVSGCAVNRRPSTTPARLHEDAKVLRSAHLQLRDSVIERLVRRAVRRGDNTLDILILSGGGAHGSYGAGFMKGWRSRSDERMPEFDLVTGVSTGALQAPYILVGTDAAIDTLVTLYRHSVERVAPSINWFFWLRRNGGLVNTAKFDRTVQEGINGAMSVELRRQFALDRQFLLTTTDMDLATGRVWSFGDEIDSTPAALARSRTLLKAATAIPGIFPPVVIDGHVHSDGGIVANAYAPLDEEGFALLADRLEARGLRNVTVRIFTIFNIWTYAPVEVIPASNRGRISDRTTVLLFYTHMPQQLQSLALLPRAFDGANGRMRIEFRHTAVPTHLGEHPLSKGLFNKDFIAMLEKEGFDRARSASPWDSVPGAFVRR